MRLRNRFDKETNRRGTGCMKWDVAERELPMWVADMDFETAPEITEAIKKRADHGIFGYTLIEDEWYEAYQSWWKNRYGFTIEKDWLIFCTGVVPAISSIVRKMTTVAEKVVVLTPVYNIFFNSILNNGRNVLESPLVYKDGAYEIDFADLEEKLADPQTSLLILCNPHNPVGKIWDKEMLGRIGDLCVKHHVLVLSDEIHCDLTMPGKDYVPFASVSENCRKYSITCIAPTKAFNIAGIQTAAVVIPDETIRHRVNRGLNTDEVAEPNVFAAIAPVAAFEKGGAWLDDLREYLWENRLYAEAFIEKEIPEIHAVKAEATYLMWLDCTAVAKDGTDLCEFIREDSGLYLCDGNEYRNGNGFLRVNLACQRAKVEDGMRRLKQSVDAYKNKNR